MNISVGNHWLTVTMGGGWPEQGFSWLCCDIFTWEWGAAERSGWFQVRRHFQPRGWPELSRIWDLLALSFTGVLAAAHRSIFWSLVSGYSPQPEQGCSVKVLQWPCSRTGAAAFPKRGSILREARALIPPAHCLSVQDTSFRGWFKAGAAPSSTHPCRNLDL